MCVATWGQVVVGVCEVFIVVVVAVHLVVHVLLMGILLLLVLVLFNFASRKRCVGERRRRQWRDEVLLNLRTSTEFGS
jgi:type IV secretory pathway VirB3-like protein